MKRLIIVFCAFVTSALMISCNQNPSGYDRQEVADIIASHDTTILYFMTSWCQASQNDFENNLKPYLGKASDNKAIVLVGLGEIEQISSLENLDQNLMICNPSSRNPLLDKRLINKECQALLSDYKRVNYTPVKLVCNRKGEILNWDADEESGRTYGSIYPYLIGWK